MAKPCSERADRLVRTLAAAVAALAIAAPGHGQPPPDRGRTEALARRAGERLQALQNEAEALAARERTLLGDLRKLELDRQMKTEALKQANAHVATVSADLASTEDRIRALEREEHAERPALRARLVEIYKLGRARYVRLLLSTADLRRMAQATRTVAALADQDRRRIVEHQKTLDELRGARETLAARAQEAEHLRDEAKRAEAAAARAAAARDALIRDVDARRDLNAQLTAELQTAQQQLQLALRTLDTGRAAGGQPSLPLRPFRGDLPWPAEGTVRYRFGDPAARRAGSSNGMEIAAPEGAPVRAVHDGVVAFAGPFAGFGNLVIVDHGSNAFSLYGNLLDVAVGRGAHVGRGDAVGTVGSPLAGPPGLYFELRVDGRPVDPLQWLGKR